LREGIRPLLPGLDPALDTVAAVRGAPKGTLRINLNKSAAHTLLCEVVPRFLSKHPAVELDLVSDGRFVDIVAAGFDAGLHLKRGAETASRTAVLFRFHQPA
jgi:DNA-binding transcriptional LysR family regulator